MEQETVIFLTEINNFLNKVQMNKTDFARSLDMRYSTIYRWLKGILAPTPSTMNHVRLFIKHYKPSRIKAKRKNARPAKV